LVSTDDLKRASDEQTKELREIRKGAAGKEKYSPRLGGFDARARRPRGLAW
jgi:hypothetical protein